MAKHSLGPAIALEQQDSISDLGSDRILDVMLSTFRCYTLRGVSIWLGHKTQIRKALWIERPTTQQLSIYTQVLADHPNQPIAIQISTKEAVLFRPQKTPVRFGLKATGGLPRDQLDDFALIYGLRGRL